jgi:hypothetical protein
MGNNIFIDSIFIHPIHSKLIETEFYTGTIFKLLPLILSILGVILYTLILESNLLVINYHSIKSKSVKYYTKIFIFFNQRFYSEFFINTFIIQKVLNVSYTLNKTLDRGFIEL